MFFCGFCSAEFAGIANGKFKGVYDVDWQEGNERRDFGATSYLRGFPWRVRQRGYRVQVYRRDGGGTQLHRDRGRVGRGGWDQGLRDLRLLKRDLPRRVIHGTAR